ncbi:MAG TPA: foldase [Firmicutes bacterium]|nr:foldase [Bacillota bacterium]
MKKHFVALAAVVCSLTLGACSSDKEVVTLPNGNENFITTDGYNVTKQDVFNAMVEDYGLTALLDLVDYDVLSAKYEIDNEEIDTAIDTYKTIYEDFDQFLKAQGFSSEEELRIYLETNLLRKAAVKASITLTEEEIQAYYEENYVATDEEEETEEEETEEETEVPALEDVRSTIEEKLYTSKMTNEVTTAALAKERAEVGFVIYNEFLQEQYKTVDTDYTATKETADVLAKTDAKSYTLDEVYASLESAYGLSTGVSLVDQHILESKYKVDEKEVKATIDEFKVALGENYYAYMKQYGLNDDQEIYDYFELVKLQEMVFEAEYPISEDKLKELYETSKPDISAYHILVETEEEAKALITQLDAAEDKEEAFKELAIEHSTDTGSATNGGDLGAFSEGDMVAEFEEAAFALEVGTYTAEPVETQYGYHIIYKYDEAEKQSYEDMKEELDYTARQEEYTQTKLELILIKYREEANFKFTSETLQDRYDTIVASIVESE